MSNEDTVLHLLRQAKRRAAIAVIDDFRDTPAWVKMDNDTALSAAAYLLASAIMDAAKHRGSSVREVWDATKVYLDAVPWDE